ncbi:non-hydrolyzing UDP-N-acetylglucosamine 2-epimerase [Fusibacter bizertensis]
MNKKKVMIVFGTRPEASKMCTVVKAFKNHTEWFETQLVVTGQHKEQLYQVLDSFGVIPDLDLEIMKENQSLAYVTSTILQKMDSVLKTFNPDILIVHGDTQTTFGATLAGYFNKIAVCHVEAGLRTHNNYSPWPEEINRKFVDDVADLLFAPTKVNLHNLLNEGIKREHIYITGQTAVDASLEMKVQNYTYSIDELNNLNFEKYKIITMTAHRRENYEHFEGMFKAIRKIVDENKDVLVVYPVHLSPIVRKWASEILSNHDRIMLLAPLDLPDMINLISNSYMVMSDSGGLQEECTVFNKPMVLMRDTTEQPEAIEAGAVCLAGVDEASIYENTQRILHDVDVYNRMSNVKNPFGDGKASERIAHYVAQYFGLTDHIIEAFDSL